MKKIIFLTLTLFALLLLTQFEVRACSCPDDPDTTLEQKVKSNLETSKAVFSGEVIQITKSSLFTLSIKIKVKKSWKGVLTEEVNITTEIPNGGDCGYDFKVGTSYLIFARSSGANYLTTDLCSRNSSIEKAAEELKILGKGKKPEKNKL